MSESGLARPFGDNEVIPLWRTASSQRQFSSWASGSGDGEGAGDLRGPAGFSPSSRTEAQAPSTSTDADIFDVAYKKGWEDGQAALAEDQDDATRASDALADALRNVNDLASPGSFAFILTAVEALFRRCAELAVPDPELLQAWAMQLAELVDQEQKGVTLVLHPDDIALIDGKSCKLALRGDETMLRGNLKLSHSGGWIEKGSEVALDELRALIDEFSDAPEPGHG
ncbi:FliH/SctL family protein [Parasphingorhabdus sp.]|uniref:FliH/SctL family protein n=1 Tax=Parasphingorhabdus sp. TaxID=2709688 RepID=UPI0030030FFC